MHILKTDTNWSQANHHYLTSSLAVIREALEKHVRYVEGIQETNMEDSSAQQALQEADSVMSTPLALEILCKTLSLSPFERDVLLLCAGIELDSSFSTLCAAAQGNPLRTFPTFSLAMAALQNPHWSALTPAAPLRRWRLIEFGAGNTLTLSPLRIDERVLHYLAGVQHLDERLMGIVEPLQISDDLVSSHSNLAERLAKTWLNTTGASLPIVQLCGSEFSSKRTIASTACRSLGLNLCAMSAGAIPSNPSELDSLIRLWEREAVLSSSALLVDCDELDTTDAAREGAITQLIECTNGALIITSRERRHIRQRPAITFDVRKPTANEQRGIWQKALGTAAPILNGKVNELVSQFNLGTETIRNVCTEAFGNLTSNNIENNEYGNMLWDICRIKARPYLDDLAQRIDPAAAWDDLVLPEPQYQILREIAMHVRQRFRVYEDWGFAAKGLRGLGISVLFVGVSGTGKTMAAEVLANELQLDLYRIDLSQVVSKYIGETEKNLRRVFDAAEDGGAILLFDEADALFGKRSEVKDSHDRYANIEVSYLLQRMEAYRGLAILTTNMRSALDTAFLRRIRFIVQFPFPDKTQRAEVWSRIFPSGTPTENIDVNKLSRLNIAGGNIHNIALNAAFLAADAGEPVSMIHLLHAARGEYSKLEKPLTEAEIGGWI